MNQQYPSMLLEKAVGEFAKLPGVGRKTAMRLVLHLLRQDTAVVEAFGNAMITLKHEVKYCKVCHNISDTETCRICSNPARDASTICVVESIRDVMAVEATQQYRGLYHVLGGVISPMDGIGPSDLQIESLVERIALLEKNIYTTKQVFTFQEACMYIGISESMLYKLTSGKEIPHYKPRGKMIYFAKEDLDEWLLQNYEPTVDEAARMANEAAATQPFFNQRRHGKRKKN